MPLFSSYVRISHICAEVKTFITIHHNIVVVHLSVSHTNSFIFWKSGMMLLTRSPLDPLSPDVPVTPYEKSR